MVPKIHGFFHGAGLGQRADAGSGTAPCHSHSHCLGSEQNERGVTGNGDPEKNMEDYHPTVGFLYVLGL